MFMLSKMSTLALEPTQPPIQWAPCFFPRDKRADLHVDHSSPTSPEVKNEWSYTSSSPTCLHGVDRGNVTFSASAVISYPLIMW